MSERFFVDIPRQFKGRVATDTETLSRYSEDTSIFKIMPEAVVFPEDARDISILVRYAASQKGKVSLTARSAGTDMSGGPLTSSIVVDFLLHFTTILHMTDMTACVQPGVFYRDFEKEAEKHNALLPSYTASKDLNTIGGMVANNSAGEKSLTYGKTERYVTALKMVLRDGNEYEFKKLSRAELEAKKMQTNLEGEVYRRTEALIKDNIDLIEEAKPKVSKNSAGYGLWNVWDKEHDTFDLTQLFVGAQGTLGLNTEVSLRLVRPLPSSRLLVLFLREKHFARLGDIVNKVREFGPESFESYDDKTFSVMLRVFPQLFMKLGGNPFRIARDFWPEIKLVMEGGIPKLVLMAEFAGETDEEAYHNAKRAEEAVGPFGLKTHITRSAKEAEKYWTIRRESFNLLRKNVRGKHTAPFIDDFVVPPECLPDFMPKLYAILDEYDLIYTVAGHVGDGNFHIIPLMDFSRPDFTDIIMELSDRVYTLVVEFGGSITGEHNDGLIRTPYLGKMFSPSVLELFSEVKNIYDPDRIFNPHKKVDALPELLRTAIKHDT